MFIVIARSEATKQSSFLLWQQAGLLRFARNDEHKLPAVITREGG
jgi:hypothetical protein